MAKPYYPDEETKKRFWSHVDKRGLNECWLWTGTVNGKGRDTGGYGMFGGRIAHRLAYEIFYGPTMIEKNPDFVVGHLCMNFDPELPNDVRRCCNPRHLNLISRSVDKMRKSRRTAGPKQFTEKVDVLRVLRLCYLQGRHYEDAAEMLGLNSQKVWAWVRGKSQKKVFDEFRKEHGIGPDRIAEVRARRRKKL